MAIISSQQGLGNNPEFRFAGAVVLPLIRSFSSALLSVLKDSTRKRKPCPFSPERVGAGGPVYAEPPLRTAPPKAQITVGCLEPIPLPARFRGSVPDSHGLSVPELVLYPTLPNELAVCEPLAFPRPRALAREALCVLRLASEG